MADTQRIKTDLMTLCADNTAGAITPQVLRDFIESAAPSYGALHFVDSVANTAIATAGVFVKAANPTVLDGAANRFTMPVDNRLLYGGTAAIRARPMASLSVTCATSNETLGFAFAKNGIVVVPSIMRVRHLSSTDVGGVNMHCYVDMVPGDFLELWVTDETSTSAVIINHGYFSVTAWMS